MGIHTEQENVHRKRKASSLNREIYQKFLIFLFLFMSCFTVLYFFSFTDSYANRQCLADGKQRKTAVSTQNTKDSSIGKTDGDSLDESRKKAWAFADKKQKLLPCGVPIGIYLETSGILVAGLEPVTLTDGDSVTPCSGRVEPGDYIIQVQGIPITSKEQFRDLMRTSKGHRLQLVLERDGQKRTVAIQPVLSKTEEYFAGLWVRDDMHGIGTLTWLDGDSQFAALGHCISDIDTGTRLNLLQGKLYHAEIYSLIKAGNHQPGSLAGAIDYRLKSCIGTVQQNKEEGVFGQGNQGLKDLVWKQLKDAYHAENFSELWEKAALETASQNQIRDGKAQMLNCFSGNYTLYDINIRKISCSDEKNKNINMEIEITDEALLKQTGGILQGMSGSPIIQDGKLIGAVTHVFVEDSSKGYGIFVENMLKH